MTKRTFVLFFSLVQFLAFGLLSQQSLASYSLNSAAGNFFPYAIQSAGIQDDFVVCDETLDRNATFVQADEFEWKENLSSLLRHRHSTYRFLTTVSQNVPDYSLAQIPKLVRESLTLPVINKGGIVRPDYYSFLHRLCPF